MSKSSLDSENQELYFGIDSENTVENDQLWYQDNLDIVLPLFIIVVGLFQYIFAKMDSTCI